MGSEVAYTGTPHQCVMELHTGVPQETVVQFYESRLSGGDWRLDTFSDQTGTMTFHRISQPQTGGKVIFVANAQGTSVNILVRGR